MAQVINTGGGDSGAGLAVGLLLAVVILVGAYFVFFNGNFANGPTTNIEAPDVKIEAPRIDVPAANN